MNYNIVIPSRFSSQRLPGKPLLDIAGKPMIQRVYEAACQTDAQKIVIATDDERIKNECQRFGAQVCMTSIDHQSGTDRIQEVAQQLNFSNEDIIVNLQGDEPLMPAAVIEQVAKNLQHNSQMSMATLCERINDPAEINNPNIVKTIFSRSGRALYFSRAAIPFARDQKVADQIFRHLGVYAYRAKFLHDYVNWPISYLEKVEKLEQLRALDNDVAIHVDIACQSIPPGVDTQEDLDLVRKYFASQR